MLLSLMQKMMSFIIKFNLKLTEHVARGAAWNGDQNAKVGIIREEIVAGMHSLGNQNEAE